MWEWGPLMEFLISNCYRVKKRHVSIAYIYICIFILVRKRPPDFGESVSVTPYALFGSLVDDVVVPAPSAKLFFILLLNLIR